MTMKSIAVTIRRELLSIIPPTLFFLVTFGLLVLTKHLMLKQYGIQFSDFGAIVVGALIIGKVVLIADHLKITNRFPNRPLIYRITWKSLVYVTAAFIVRTAEELVPRIITYGSLRQGMAHLVDEVIWPHFWVIYIWLSVLLFTYCSLRELVRVIGEHKVLELFFGITRRQPTEPQST
jgi:hypothetical protein